MKYAFSIGLVLSLLGLPAIAGAQDRDGGVAANAAGPDGVAEEAPTRLVCGGEDICVIQARQATAQRDQGARLDVVERRVSALQAAADAAAARRRAAQQAAAPRPGFVPLPTRVRRLEPVVVATAQALEAMARDLPRLISLNTQCEMQRTNPRMSIALPPGTDCDQVARDLEAAQAAAARPAAQAVATINPTANPAAFALSPAPSR